MSCVLANSRNVSEILLYILYLEKSKKCQNFLGVGNVHTMNKKCAHFTGFPCPENLVMATQLAYIAVVYVQNASSTVYEL